MRWISPGPVSTAFVESRYPVSVLMGPAAGGKTHTSLQRGVMKAFTWPVTHISPQGVKIRRAAFLVMRRKMTDLEASTLDSWHTWFPKKMGHFTGKEGGPKKHELVMDHPTGGVVELTVRFRGIGDDTIDDALRGFEFSYAYLDECDLEEANTMDTLTKRAGRYPNTELMPYDQLPAQVWGSCNAPEPDSWVVKELIDGHRPGWKLYRQPSGLSPEAENLRTLGPNYYQQRASVMKKYEVDRFVRNIPGLSRDASAVYEEVDPDLHISARALKPVPQLKLLAAMDAGGTPAVTLSQRMPNGQLRYLGEITTHDKELGSVTGPTRFGEMLAALLNERFPGMDVEGVADPSAAYGADTGNGEASWIDIVARTAGITVRPARTNDPVLRTEALRKPMLAHVAAGVPALLIDGVNCPFLAKALTREYKFTIIKTTGRRSDRPMKNWASHIVEAAQYGALEHLGLAAVQSRQASRSQGPRTPPPAFNPFHRSK